MTKTIKQLLLSTKAALNSTLEAKILLQHLLNISYEEILQKDNQIILDKDIRNLEQLIQRRLAKEPIAYITGSKEFYSLDFSVTKNTLIPRPDSETLIDAVLSEYDKNFNGRIIDLGTGSGCLIITLLKHLQNAHGVAIDISDKALAVAKQNSNKHDVSDRLELLNTSWNNLKLDTKYDILISNPPYIETNDINILEDDVKNFEPITALNGGTDGMSCYKEIFDLSRKTLKHQSKIFIEIGHNQENQIRDLSIKKGLVVLKTYQDLTHIVRCIQLALD
ncbi:MAG: peptide chain release factor N(5)-glutamine methyltransferase [Rickettsiales bacterium]|nr:peptide chain release factor N(5)-glutamine methyltransferase [Rickettsiales bacterium]